MGSKEQLNLGLGAHEVKGEVLGGDCLELLKGVEAASIDMILCDLPYGSTRNRWDIMLPLDRLWEEYRRVIKARGAIVLFGQGIFSARLILAQPELYRYSLIWEKTRAGGFLNARRMPLAAHEDILVFYKAHPIYNPQMTVAEPYKKVNRTNGESNNYGKFTRVGHVFDNHGTRFPRSVLKFKNSNYQALHPQQKPIALLEYLIRTYTNPGMLVLDNTAGSGSTGVACVNTGRNYILMEQEPAHVAIIKSRLGITC